MTDAMNVDATEIATSSTSSEEHSAAMSRLVKKMASFCFTCDVESRIFEREHELGVGKDLTKKVESFLVDSKHNLQTVLVDDHAKYDLFS